MFEVLMIPEEMAGLAVVILTAVLTGGLAALVFGSRAQNALPAPRKLIEKADRNAVFLFDDQALTDATPSARELLRAAPPGSTPWQQLTNLLAVRFPTLQEDLSELGSTGTAEVFSAGESDGGVIRAEWWEGIVRLELTNHNAPESEITLDNQSVCAANEELALLRHVTDESPMLAWQVNEVGQLIWANPAYMKVAEVLRAQENGPSWPPPDAFPELAEKPAGSEAHRISLKTPLTVGERPRWFDCKKTIWNQTVLCVAQETGGEVNARAALDEFVQTLSKTFAHLSVGLAVFDKDRQLALFNPALIDLTGLDVLFLSQRPQLSSFLDHLRDKRMIPEPKNYATWRDHLKALETSAVDGTYEETWPLPSGQTYRVTGRPHPNGAIAFQFEDITPEIALTRQFRAELELGQAVMDSMPDAMVVFSPGGTLTISNTAYSVLWGNDPGASLRDLNFSDAVAHWAEASVPGAIWERLGESVNRIHNRAPWQGDAELSDGRPLRIFLAPLTGGATLIRFAVGNSAEKPRILTTQNDAVGASGKQKIAREMSDATS